MRRRGAPWSAEVNRAIALRESGRSKEAADLLVALLDRGLPRRQVAAVTGVLAGIVLYDLHQPARAEPYCRDSVALSPRSELASLALFHALWRLRRPMEAFQEMQRFLRVVHESEEYQQLIREIANGTRDPARAREGIQAYVAGLPPSDWRCVLDEIRSAFDPEIVDE